MAEQMLYISKNAENYSAGLKKLIKDISEEMNNGIKDGLAYKLASVENEEAKLYSFIKNEGYGITYKEFSEFISDAKEMITANGEFIDSILTEQMSDEMSEKMSEELSDSDLEQVAGGRMKWWQWLLIGVAAVALIVACVVAAPVAAIVGTALATGWGAAMVGGGAATVIGVAVANSVGVAVGVGIAAGVAIAAGAGAGLGALA